MSSFVRAALLAYLERLETEEPGIGQWHHVAAIEELIRVKDEQLAFANIITGLRDQLNAMADAGEWADLEEHLGNIMATIHSQPEGSRKQTYLKYMEEFQYRLNGFKNHALPAPKGRPGMVLGEIPDADSQ